MVIFVIFAILKCDLSPINTPQGINMVIKIFLALFLINSCQFYMIKIFGGLKYSPLKMTIESIHSIAYNDLFYQISVKSWQMRYQIKVPNPGVH